MFYFHGADSTQRYRPKSTHQGRFPSTCSPFSGFHKTEWPLRQLNRENANRIFSHCERIRRSEHTSTALRVWDIMLFAAYYLLEIEFSDVDLTRLARFGCQAARIPPALSARCGPRNQAISAFVGARRRESCNLSFFRRAIAARPFESPSGTSAG